jgi:hypothetical protein
VSKRRRRRQEKERRHGRSHPTRRRLAAGAGLTVGATLAAGGTAQATDFTVNSTLDNGDNTCDLTAGGCTLRDAVGDANDNSGPDDVLFQSGLSGTITLTPTPQYGLGVSGPTYIQGPGAGQLAVSGNDAARIFTINEDTPGDPVSISGLTLTDASFAGQDGGAVLNADADLTISDAVVRDSNSAGGNGGGIASVDGTLTLERSTVSGNMSGSGPVGGGIYADDDLYVVDSTIAGNTAGSFGGGVYASYSSNVIHRGPHTIRNSTIAGNTAGRNGGGVYFYGAKDEADLLTIESSTIAGNNASGSGGDGYGGGVSSEHQGAGYLGAALENTIVANNTAAISEPDVAGDLLDASFSLIQDPGSAGITEGVADSNIYAVDPQLGPLASNGGPTMTQALAPTSPAVDKGSSALTADQRGQLRPFDFAATANSSALGADASDMGAFELQPADIPAASAVTPTPAVTAPKCKGKTATVFTRPGLARTLTGTNKRDVIVGTTKKDKIKAKGGNDLVCAKGGKDTVKGGGGKDRLFGQGGKDLLLGGAGKDLLSGGGRNDTCIGGAGRDTEKSC